MFVTHDVDEALTLGDRVVVLGRHGLVAEHRIPHPREPGGSAPSELRGRILDDLSTTHSLAPIIERTPA